jgi:hypothetical protein
MDGVVQCARVTACCCYTQICRLSSSGPPSLPQTAPTGTSSHLLATQSNVSDQRCKRSLPAFAGVAFVGVTLSCHATVRMTLLPQCNVCVCMRVSVCV